MVSKILKDVIYYLLDWEADGRRYAEEPDSHGLDGELCLIFESGEKMFVTWRDPVIKNGDYSIDFAPKRSTTSEVSRTCNMAGHSLWKSFVEQRVCLRREQIHNTCMVVLTAENGQQLFCCPYEQEQWGADTLYISQTIPT